MDINIRPETYNSNNKEDFIHKLPPGLSKDVVEQISRYKKEPDWMLKKRLRCLEIFEQLSMPNWGPSLEKLDIENITFFADPNSMKNAKSWEDLPDDIKKTFDRLGIPKAEREALAGAGSQYESMTVYHNLKKEWAEKGVIFEDFDVAVKEYPELVQKYFMTKCVAPTLHKFAALHGAVFSGGTFIYVPPNVNVTIPLQAYFRMNSERMGQFEHTLIIVDEGAEVHYVEGCSSPKYNSSSLHAGCVEVIVMKGAKVRYSSIENWSKNTFNLNTKRAVVDENGVIEWVNGNTGSASTMLYPTSVLFGKGARSEYLGIAFAGKGQNQDTGTKVYHLAPNTTSIIQSKSISTEGGVTTYRGLVKVSKKAKHSKVSVECDALMTDSLSSSNTIPYIQVENDDVDLAHEATVGSISDETIFYLMSRGISEADAKKMIVSGFIEPIVKALPLEYAIEFNKLIELEMEGSLG